MILTFDNTVLRGLPTEPAQEPGEVGSIGEGGDGGHAGSGSGSGAGAGVASRLVRGACFSRVRPEPIEEPRVVAVSTEALALLGVPPEQALTPEFAEAMGGCRVLPGSEPAAHCYAGHQFQMFSGQLGDGAAMYLGEVVDAGGARWELQLKGAGRTPFSRAGDGRKVLRSSVREFLASEAMHHLGIPTTRAASVVVGSTLVERDAQYDGRPRMEQCAVVARVAPTFLRFGSFEIFKARDPITGREGPSHGLEGEMLASMLNFTTRSYFPHIWASAGGDAVLASGGMQALQDVYLEWYREVVRRTASLVAGWQSVGFVHGVLNTDNMSVLGLTLDYGPFGFMERFDPHHVANGSDDSGLYNYTDQPAVCRWNCQKLAEALSPVLPLRATKDALLEFDVEFEETRLRLLRAKLGLTARELPGDSALWDDLLEAMGRCGSDFSTIFHTLARFPMPPAAAADATGDAAASGGSSGDGGAAARPQLRYKDGGVLDTLMASRASLAELAGMAEPRMPPESLHLLSMMGLRERAALLGAMGLDMQVVSRELERMARHEELCRLPEAERSARDLSSWVRWLNRYGDRLAADAAAGATADARRRAMAASNPRFVLRNWLAQRAIARAEGGDPGEINCLLEILKQPFAEGSVDDVMRAADARVPPSLRGPAAEAAATDAGGAQQGGGYDALAPPGEACARVTCSS